jgi:hypothetical protein
VPFRSTSRSLLKRSQILPSHDAWLPNHDLMKEQSLRGRHPFDGRASYGQATPIE